MRFAILLVTFLFVQFNAFTAEKKTVCLNMIIKDESPVIERCLASVKPIIDTWVIVDTGSTDGTQEIVKNFMKDMPGELHERPWVNFGHNRNEALQLAKGKADYVLIIDADEVLTFKPEFKMPDLTNDFYYIMTDYSGTNYVRTQLIKNSLDWKWVGALHEVLCCDQAATVETLQHVSNFVRSDGNRSTDPLKFHKDAKILEQAMLENPYNARDRFYLAQSYRDAGENELALLNYNKRIAMEGWDQEVFWSKLQAALLQDTLVRDPETVRKGYMDAYLFRPTRAEPLYRLALYNRRQNDYQASYEAAQKGLHLKQSDDVLFVEKWIYDYGLLLEYSIAAYWIDKQYEALLASKLLLADTTLPKHVRECVERNLYWINLKINENLEQEKQLTAAVN